jgi:hypothetical protein
MNVSFQSSILIPSFSPKLHQLIFDYTSDPIELLQKHGNMKNLSAEEQGFLRETAPSCKKLDFRGTNITWGDLQTISSLFVKLRYLDLRNCPQLQPERWTKYLENPIKDYKEHKELKNLFPCHDSLTIRVHEDIEIVADTLYDSITRIVVIRRDQGKEVFGRAINESDQIHLAPYVLPRDALSFRHFSELEPIEADERYLHRSDGPTC